MFVKKRLPKYVIGMIPSMENCGHSDVDSMLLILQDILNGLSEKMTIHIVNLYLLINNTFLSIY